MYVVPPSANIKEEGEPPTTRYKNERVNVVMNVLFFLVVLLSVHLPEMFASRPFDSIPFRISSV